MERIFEISIKDKSGEWIVRRGHFASFHEAVKFGLDKAGEADSRLMAVEEWFQHYGG